MRRVCLVLFLVGAIATFPAPVSARPNWLTTGIGEGSSGLGLGVGYSVAVRHMKFSVRGISTYRDFSDAALLFQAQAYGAGHLGLVLYGDVNEHKSFVGGLVSWRFRQFR